jgi:hypothetical protein
MKKLSIAALLLTLALSAMWTALSLYRWEWTRALWMTIVFVGAEVTLIGIMILQRLRHLEQRIEDSQHAVAVRRRSDGIPPTDRFEWLREVTNRTNVFVTVFLGGGVVVSAVLWVVDKLAGRSVESSHQRKLAALLRPIAFPISGFVPPDSVLFAADFDRDEREDLALLLLGRSELPR